MPKPLPKSPYLNKRFANAVNQFGIHLKNTASINHRGNKGAAREQELRNFFDKNLPDKFSVSQGEAVDLLGSSSQQFDLLIYDNTINFPFSNDAVSILPAEAVLATVEIKSKLTAEEIKKCIDSSRKLRKLKPFGRELAGSNVGDAVKNKPKQCRYFHCVFAYETNIVEKNWKDKEFSRITDLAADEHLVDMVYVLNRGILNIPAKLCRLEDESGGAISSFYYSILNFVMRESARRDPAPYDRYTTHNPNSWVKL
ncbi:DUF6602 domain-containing protein [Dankookia sp. GCM10030260]|uniref:DUF6602 domain-containing protein n=1 Tax=Dankookia sp. GCM10030260 TaxID=3273390 RepID=UPI00360EFF98